MSRPTPWCLTYRYPMPPGATRTRPEVLREAIRRAVLRAAFAKRWARNEAGYRLLGEEGRD